MLVALKEKDYQRLLAFVSTINALGDFDEQNFPGQLVSSLSNLIQADSVSYNHFAADFTIKQCVWSPEDPVMPNSKQTAVLQSLIEHHPLAGYFQRSGFSPSIKLSDQCSQKAFRENALYRELYRPLGVEYQLYGALSLDDQDLLVIAYNLGHKDFSLRQKTLLHAAMPHINHCMENRRLWQHYELVNKVLEDSQFDSRRGVCLLNSRYQMIWQSALFEEYYRRYFGLSQSKQLADDIMRIIKSDDTYKNKVRLNAKDMTSYIDVSVQNLKHPSVYVVYMDEVRNEFSAMIEHYELSPRECEVLQYISMGGTNAHIAMQLHIADSTVKKHVENIFRKIGVENRVQAIGLLNQNKA